MVDIFTNPIPTNEQQVTRQIDQNLRQTARAMKSSYDNIRKLVYDNANFPNPDDAYAAFATNTTTGLTPTDLGKAAMLIKTVINAFVAGTIVDDVPEVTITYQV